MRSDFEPRNRWFYTEKPSACRSARNRTRLFRTLGRAPEPGTSRELALGASIYPDHRSAALAFGAQLCDGRTWTRLPAAFDGRHQPVEPGWLRSGQSWYRTDEPEHTNAEP